MLGGGHRSKKEGRYLQDIPVERVAVLIGPVWKTGSIRPQRRRIGGDLVVVGAASA